MPVHSLRTGFCKRILFCLLCVSFLNTTAGSQTLNWTGNAGEVWTRSGSWAQLQTPVITSIAVIDGGNGSTLALREGTLAGTVAVRNLLLRR